MNEDEGRLRIRAKGGGMRIALPVSDTIFLG